MFGLFGKKKAALPDTEAPDSAVTTPLATGARPLEKPPERSDVAAIIERWDLAIVDVLARNDAVLSRATADSGALVAAVEGDFGPLSRLWTKTKADVRPFIDELQERWSAILDELAELAPPEGTTMREGNKLHQATTELEVRYELAFRSVMSRAAIVLQGKAATRPELLPLFKAAAPLYLAQHAARDAWVTMYRADTWIKNYRNKKEVPMSLLEELETQTRRYWTAFLGVEAEHAPELAPYVQQKLSARMKELDRTLMQYWQWRARNAPT